MYSGPLLICRVPISSFLQYHVAEGSDLGTGLGATIKYGRRIAPSGAAGNGLSHDQVLATLKEWLFG
jgi:hypothetical protein